MRIARFLALVVLTLGLSAVSAQASIITLNYDFSASGFDTGAPIDPVTGSFSVTFDNATSLSEVTSGISLTGLNINLDSAPAFTYVQLSDLLFIGGSQVGVGGIQFPSNDFQLLVGNVSTAPTFIRFIYTQSPENLSHRTTSGTLTPTEVSAVPEPASLTLLGLGLAGMAGRRWRQRKR